MNRNGYSVRDDTARHLRSPAPTTTATCSRALVDAARRLLETEGPAALSLRAVAREAGVSPAAPYHHFKDKGELLDAVAHEGWAALDVALTDARTKAADSKAAA